VHPADIMLEALRDCVGGEEALDALDDIPLPDEPFSWSDISDDVHDRVREVFELCDGACDELCSVEYRTACRRFLARAARGDPAVFRRRARAETAAAAVCWIVGKANDLFTSWTGEGMLVKDPTAHFGLAAGGVSQRAETLLKAAGVERAAYAYGRQGLGSPDFLVARRRRAILDERGRYRAMVEE